MVRLASLLRRSRTGISMAFPLGKHVLPSEERPVKTCAELQLFGSTTGLITQFKEKECPKGRIFVV